jgi:hypothetical protein
MVVMDVDGARAMILETRIMGQRSVGIRVGKFNLLVSRKCQNWKGW